MGSGWKFKPSDFFSDCPWGSSSWNHQWIGFVGKIFTGNHGCSHFQIMGLYGVNFPKQKPIYWTNQRSMPDLFAKRLWPFQLTWKMILYLKSSAFPTWQCPRIPLTHHHHIKKWFINECFLSWFSSQSWFSHLVWPAIINQHDIPMTSC